MCLMQLSRRVFLVFGLLSGAALSSMAISAEQPKPRTLKGEFASFEDGKLTIKVYNRDSRKGNTPDLTTAVIPASAKTLIWNHDERKLQPVDTIEAMRQLTALVTPVDASHVETAETMLWRKAGAGLVIQIAKGNVTIRIGENSFPPFGGNLISFKDDFLLFQLKDPSPALRRNYGDSVRFKMNEAIPVYESIDGGEYQRVGTPRTAFANVKEGTEITVFHNYKTETDEFYLVLVGMKKK